MPYVGRDAASFTTVVDVTVSDDLTVTDDATIGGDLAVTGNVGIGTSSPSVYANKKTLELDAAWGGSFDNSVSGTVKSRWDWSTGGFTQFGTIANEPLALLTNNTERMRIESGGDIDVGTGDIYFSTAGKGIVLGATSNTDANTLHDYEEGTWTPRITASTAGVATAGASNNGYYTKVGNLVKLSGRIQWTEITTATMQRV